MACWLVDSRIPLLGAQQFSMRLGHVASYEVLFDGPAARLKPCRPWLSIALPRSC
jgi:hypothetical protein